MDLRSVAKVVGIVALCVAASASAVGLAGAQPATPTISAGPLAAAPTASPSPSADHSPSPNATAGASPTAAAAAVAPATPDPASSPDWGVVAGPDWVVTNPEPLPPCALGEVATPLSGQSAWALTLVDTTYTVGSCYVPDDLVSAGAAGLSNYQYVRSVMIGDLRNMVGAASAAGAPLGIASSYRSYDTQVWTFWYWVNMLGYDYALKRSARAGHSEHQLGLAIDFESAGGPDPWTYYDFARQTAAGAWLKANAWQYGFIMSYPLGSVDKTCYGYEPWHYRYVGVAEAAAVRASGLTLREWLWMHQPYPEPDSPGPVFVPGPTP